MISSKAKQFIKDYTKRCSNELEALPPIYKEWLTPEQAECACEVEREEVIKRAVKWLEKNVCEATGWDSYEVTELFKKSMKE